MTDTVPPSSEDTSNALGGRVFCNRYEDAVAFEQDGQRLEIVLDKSQPTLIIASSMVGDEQTPPQKIVLPRGFAVLFTRPKVQELLGSI